MARALRATPHAYTIRFMLYANEGPPHFNFNGMGLLFWQSAQNRDYPILLGVTIILALATVIGALVADMLYAVADPRVRLAGKK